MSINQVINANDEIINGTPKYTITPNGDGTNGIVLANEVVQNGTPYNKNILDKIDNVLSYLTPSVEKVEAEGPEIYSNDHYLMPISTNWESITNYNKYKGFYHLISGQNDGIVKIYTDDLYSNTSSNALSKGFDNDTQTQANLNNNGEIIIEFDKKIKAVGVVISLNNTLSVQIFGSNNNLDYDLLNLSDDTITNPEYYKYYKIKGTKNTSSSYWSLVNFNINKFYYKLDAYQNAFTLDNNTTFTNNQRVLVDTPVGKDTYIFRDDYDYLSSINKSWVENDTINDFKILTAKNNEIEFNANITLKSINPNNTLPSNTASMVTFANANFRYSSEDFVNLLKQENTDIENNYVQIKANSTGGVVDLIYDFSNTSSIGKCINIDWSGDSGYISIDESANKTDWNHKESINASGVNTIINSKIYNFNENTKFVKITFYFDTANKRFTIRNLKTNDYVFIPKGMDIEEVSSNTINDVPCDTLLQPSTKYELIYNESTNKFELGGGPILYDITLTESVTRVDLNGISKKLKFNKLYSISIDGKASDGITVKFGSNTYGCLSFRYPENITKEIGEVMFFVNNYLIKNNLETLSLFLITGNSNSQNTNLLSAGTNYEYLDFTNALNAGTRIIIKEVA